MAIKGNPIMENVARLNRTGLNGLTQHGTDGLQTVITSHAWQYMPEHQMPMRLITDPLNARCCKRTVHYLHPFPMHLSICAGLFPGDGAAAHQLYH